MPVRPAWLVAAVVVAASVPYLRTITDYFVQDDFGTVMILTNRPWTTFPRWFTMSWMEEIWGAVPDEIRPFVAFTYQLTGKWAPHRPELHHLMNIALHAGNAVLVMAIGRTAIGLAPVSAAFAGIVFAVLPAQAESAAWITGRVDSMPAFFYLATFLAYVKWRLQSRRWWYGCALLLFFVTLFSKQNAITMPATIAAYDLIVLDQNRRGSLLSCIKAWLPFIVMTAGYLALRRVVLGHTVRGGVQSWYQVESFLEIVGRHFQRVSLGHTAPLADWELTAAVALAILCIVALWMRPSSWRIFLCFCVAWWAIGCAPILVAGYESPRHVYLASAAWAFLLALVADALYPRLQRPVLRNAAAAVAVVVIGVYVVRLHAILQDWHALARISKSAIEQMNKEAAAAPPGTLLLVSVPKKSWEWGVPFVLQPPYQREDLTNRVRVVTPWALYCCGQTLWRDYARRHLQAWVEAAHKPPLIALHFAPRSGELSRVTDAENPELRAFVPVLLQTDTPQALDIAIVDLLERVAEQVRQP
jgi:hypothetical protein